jgi:hypothetical protein
VELCLLLQITEHSNKRLGSGLWAHGPHTMSLPLAFAAPEMTHTCHSTGTKRTRTIHHVAPSSLTIIKYNPQQQALLFTQLISLLGLALALAPSLDTEQGAGSWGWICSGVSWYALPVIPTRCR